MRIPTAYAVGRRSGNSFLARRPSGFVWAVNITPEQRTILVRMALVSHGGVQRLGGRRGGESGRTGPPGESLPMHEEWFVIFKDTPEHQAVAITEQAQADLDAWLRRPLAHDTTETMEELNARIVADGWGIDAVDCSVAMRCTVTMVRRARLAEMRHPDTGLTLPHVDRDPLGWANALDAVGLTLRQIEAITGIPKSTLHDRLGRIAPPKQRKSRHRV